MNGERKEEKRETNERIVSCDAGLACFFSRNVLSASQVMALFHPKLWVGRVYGSMDKRDDHA